MKGSMLARIAKAQGDPVQAERRPVQPSTRSRQEIVDQFIEYARDYRARVTVSENLTKTLNELLANAKSVVIAPDLDSTIAPPNAIKDNRLSPTELDRIDASVTLCAVGIAETGTFVLDGGPGQGRRAISLIPDHHICIIRRDQIVDTVPEAVQALKQSVLEGRPLTWVSGPSATSDIELTRVEGVHGARNLDIVVIE